MGGGLVGRARLPTAPQNAEPGAGEDADGVRMVAAAGASSTVDVGGPRGGVTRVVGEAGQRLSQALVAREAEGDAAVLAGSMGDGRYAGLGGELVVAGEAEAIVTELGEDLRGVDAAGARERGDDGAVRVGGDGVLDGRGELDQLREERVENAHESAHELALGLGLRRAAETGRCAAQPLEKERGGTPAAVAVLGKEVRQALVPETLGTLRGGVAIEEGKGDRRVHLGEDGGRARPEALEQRAQLVGERDTLMDQVVPGAHQGPQRASLIGKRPKGTEAVAVGAQQIGEDERVAWIALALGRRVAWPRCLERVGVNGHHGEASLDERIDEQPGGALDRHRQLGSELDELTMERIHSCSGVRHIEAGLHLADRVHDADSVLGAGPVDPYEQRHGIPPWFGLTVLGAGRPCRSLTDRRSGLQSLRRYILWPVGTSRSLRWGRSRAGRRAASDAGPHRRGTGST